MPPRTNPKTGKSYDVFADVQNHINDQLNANKRAVFIEHYMNTYDNPPTPPSWMSVELLYFSELSKICQNLKSRKDRTDIAAAFGIADETVFCSWLHTLNYLRNICAHHARLWNIELDVNPKKYFNKNFFLICQKNNLFNAAKFCIILHQYFINRMTGMQCFKHRISAKNIIIHLYLMLLNQNLIASEKCLLQSRSQCLPFESITILFLTLCLSK